MEYVCTLRRAAGYRGGARSGANGVCLVCLFLCSPIIYGNAFLSCLYAFGYLPLLSLLVDLAAGGHEGEPFSSALVGYFIIALSFSIMYAFI